MQIHPSTGVVERVGTTPVAVTPIAGVGDLAAIDPEGRVFYYLGDGLNGTGARSTPLNPPNPTLRAPPALRAVVGNLLRFDPSGVAPA